MGGIGQLPQQVTVGSLPDDVLLKIFKFFVDAIVNFYYAPEQWRTLVHICRRWRNLAFTSPRHLNLLLLCKPPWRSVDILENMLDIWPELPIYLLGWDHPGQEAIDDVVAVLKLNHRVSRIHLKKTSRLAWETFAPLMQHPFPALTYLWVEPYVPIQNEISSSFLGGSAPCLQDLLLAGFPFPALPELLLSAPNLIHLRYQHIPPSGYISPEAIVTSLSALTRLESLSLTFLPPEDLPDRAIRISPPHMRTLLPALTYLRYQGVPGYMEDLVAQIDAPLLEGMVITLFHQEVLEVSQLAKFVRRADKLSFLDRAQVTCDDDDISVTLSQEFLVERVDPKTLELTPACREQDMWLSYLAQFCASCLPTLSPFESLHILDSYNFTWAWEDVIDPDPDPKWLELLCLFNTVKDLRLQKFVASRVAQALRWLPAERITEVLPALENIFISGHEPFGPVMEVISEFAHARQLSGQPVSIYYQEGRGFIKVGS